MYHFRCSHLGFKGDGLGPQVIRNESLRTHNPQLLLLDYHKVKSLV